MEIVAIGADNAAVEWGFPSKPDYQRKAFGFLGLPLHVDFIWNRGAYIMEILNLDELAKDQAYEFLFVLGPCCSRAGSASRSIRSPSGRTGTRAADATWRGRRHDGVMSDTRRPSRCAG